MYFLICSGYRFEFRKYTINIQEFLVSLFGVRTTTVWDLNENVRKISKLLNTRNFSNQKKVNLEIY